MISEDEIAASIILPHFHAVQDVFVAFSPGGEPLERLEKITYIVDPKIHDKRRHFAATRDDGTLMMFAPQIVDLPVDTLVAIIAHEFGHAADFAYPGRWYSRAEPSVASWIDDKDLATKQFQMWRKVWEERGRDQVEWAADGIAQAVTGKKIKYAGDCLLQTFRRGIERPKGLR